jgi:hypothetical protein
MGKTGKVANSGRFSSNRSARQTHRSAKRSAPHSLTLPPSTPLLDLSVAREAAIVEQGLGDQVVELRVPAAGASVKRSGTVRPWDQGGDSAAGAGSAPLTSSTSSLTTLRSEPPCHVFPPSSRGGLEFGLRERYVQGLHLVATHGAGQSVGERRKEQ